MQNSSKSESPKSTALVTSAIRSSTLSRTRKPKWSGSTRKARDLLPMQAQARLLQPVIPLGNDTRPCTIPGKLPRLQFFLRQVSDRGIPTTHDRASPATATYIRHNDSIACSIKVPVHPKHVPLLYLHAQMQWLSSPPIVSIRRLTAQTTILRTPIVGHVSGVAYLFSASKPWPTLKLLAPIFNLFRTIRLHAHCSRPGILLRVLLLCVNMVCVRAVGKEVRLTQSAA